VLFVLPARGGGSNPPGILPQVSVRRAELADADAIGRLLDDFNREYDYPSPGAGKVAARIAELMADGDTKVLLAGDGPDGLAVMRFRRSIWSEHLECYLAELYVAPERRGRGLGRALMSAALELARAEGADYMDLNTGEDDVAARGLYESLGFSNREGKADGAVQLYYERDL
jgi:ribosomal protein S18 acetylase RimI-like enzyme